MKIRETYLRQQGREPATLLERIIEIETAPPGAEVVEDDVPVCDWRPVKEEA